MRNPFVTCIAAAAAAAALAGAASAANTTTFAFTEHITGAQISATQSVFKLHDSHFGNAAGVQTVKLKGLGGSDSEVTYYGHATAISHGTFKLGTPNAQGISTLSGQGHDTSGTGTAHGLTSTYTYTGTFNTKTLVYTAVLTGRASIK